MIKPEAHPHKPGSRKARREAAAKRQITEANKLQAELIARRASKALTWIILVRFAAGSHEIKLHDVTTPLPTGGWQEARVSLWERGTFPGVRYNRAEVVAANLRDKLDRNRGPVRRIAGLRA